MLGEPGGTASTTLPIRRSCAGFVLLPRDRSHLSRRPLTGADMNNPLKAVVLVSGGIDSSTVLALVKRQAFEIYALSFDYGQRHRYELEAARRVTESMGIRQHAIMRFDLRAFGGSALTADIEVP